LSPACSASPLAQSGNREVGERFIERDDDSQPSHGFVSRKVLARAADPALRALSPGAYVEHKSFGRGKVIEIVDSPDPVATVKFSGWQPKRIKVSFLVVAPE
jgi:hypothetical protein